MEPLTITVIYMHVAAAILGGLCGVIANYGLARAIAAARRRRGR